MLQRAADVFLERGFEAASYDTIASDLGMSKPSLYNAFGDKSALFARVLREYTVQARTFILACFSGKESLAQAAHSTLTQGAAFYARLGEQSTGCLLVGTALPSTTQHKDIREALSEFSKQVEVGLALIIAEQYEIEAVVIGRSPEQIAKHLVSLIFALAVRARMGLAAEELAKEARDLASFQFPDAD